MPLADIPLPNDVKKRIEDARSEAEQLAIKEIVSRLRNCVELPVRVEVQRGFTDAVKKQFEKVGWKVKYMSGGFGEDGQWEITC